MMRNGILRYLGPWALVGTVLLMGCDHEQDALTDPGPIDQLNEPDQPFPGQGSQMVFQSYRDSDWDIYIMNADGSDQRQLTTHFHTDSDPALSPNGRKIAFRSLRAGTGDIYSMNTDGSGQTRLTFHDGPDAYPSWSPDGQEILFSRRLDLGIGVGGYEIFIMDADGSNQTRLTDNLVSDYRPSFSRNGQKIVFHSTREGNTDIYVMNADGSEEIRVTDDPAGDYAAAWSPNGRQIAFTSDRDGNQEIYVMNADGSGQTRLTDSPADDAFPNWSPNGRHIAFQSRWEASEEIFVMEADGSDPVQITGSEIVVPAYAGRNGRPSWGVGNAHVDDEVIAEGLIAGSYLAWWAATEWGNPSMALSTLADELTSSWGNFGMRDLSSEPRVEYDNTPFYSYRRFNEWPWFNSYLALSSVYEGIRLLDGGLDLGGREGPDNARAMAFAKLVQGLSHGFLSEMFDRAFILDETVDLETDELELVPYDEVMAVALSQLEEAITIANANVFTLPDTWINGLPLTNDDLAQLAHSYMARFMTQVARTPAERDLVDWASVIAHVDQGITDDIRIDGDGRWLWWKALEWYGSQPLWTRADYKTIGFTDLSGQFGAWLATPLNDRNEFEIVTDDARITTEGDPVVDGLYIRYIGPSQFPPVRGTYHFSFYGDKRYEDFYLSGGSSPMTHMTTAEMQLIKAEGLMRMWGPTAEAVDIINSTRVVRGQLPPASVSESFSGLMDKLIYEKRIEGYLLCGGCAFFDRRGFGPLAPTGPDFHHGLVEGTPIHFPIPGRELERLGLPYYTFGGPGSEMTPSGSAAVGRDRVPARAIFRFDLGMTGAEMIESVEERLAGRTLEGAGQVTRH
jgi:Tol biopolymer transport system component